jgi:hypothetical protein
VVRHQIEHMALYGRGLLKLPCGGESQAELMACTGVVRSKLDGTAGKADRLVVLAVMTQRYAEHGDGRHVAGSKGQRFSEANRCRGELA